MKKGVFYIPAILSIVFYWTAGMSIGFSAISWVAWLWITLYLVGAFKGIVIGTVVGIISASFVTLFQYIISGITF